MYLFAAGGATASLVGPALGHRRAECSIYTFVVNSQPPAAAPKSTRLRVLLMPGPPAQLRVELRGLTPALPAAAGDIVRFASGGGGGGGAAVAAERVEGWPRRSVLGEVAVQLVDTWGNTGMRAGSGSRCSLEAHGALLSDSRQSSGAEPARSLQRTPPARDVGEFTFASVRFAADGAAAEARLVVRWAPDGAAAARAGAAAWAAGGAGEVRAEVLLGLAGLNRVLRVVAADADAADGGGGGERRLRAGDNPVRVAVALEMEDGAGFDGASADLLAALAAECHYAPAPTAGPEMRVLAGLGRLSLYREPTLAPRACGGLERGGGGGGGGQGGGDCGEGGAAGARAAGAAVVFEGARVIFAPGEFEVRVVYREQRAWLKDLLLPGDLEVASAPLRFQASGPATAHTRAEQHRDNPSRQRAHCTTWRSARAPHVCPTRWQRGPCAQREAREPT
jgi:hypothetical protein